MVNYHGRIMGGNPAMPMVKPQRMFTVTARVHGLGLVPN